MSNIAAAQAALARGDLIATYDLAHAALVDGADGAAFLIVLSLARMGDIETARERYVAFYCGHMFNADPDIEAVLAAQIDAAVTSAIPTRSVMAAPSAWASPDCAPAS